MEIYRSLALFCLVFRDVNFLKRHLHEISIEINISLFVCTNTPLLILSENSEKRTIKLFSNSFASVLYSSILRTNCNMLN